MKAYLLSALASLREHQFYLMIAYGLVAAFLSWRVALEDVIGQRLFRVAAALSAIVTIGYLAMVAIYVISPNYFDHLEATIAIISWLGMHGHSFYPDWRSDDVYGLLYGPVLYLVQGALLSIVPTLTASKILGPCALILALGIFFVTVNRKMKSDLAAIVLVGVMVMLLAPFNYDVYWDRSEPFLLLIAVAVLPAATSVPLRTAAIVVGALAGIAVGFKIHAALYVLPSAIVLLARAQSMRDRIVVTAAGVSAGIVFCALPFLLRPVNLPGYLQYLEMAARHGLSLTLLKQNTLFALGLSILVVVAWLRRKSAIDRTGIWFLIGFFASMAITAVIAAKPGSGPSHLIPFVPLCLYGVALSAETSPDKMRRSTVIVAAALAALAFGPIYANNLRQSKYYFHIIQSDRDKVTELSSLLDAYPDAQLGVSDITHYRDSFYKVMPVLQGHPVHVDLAAWMDMQFAHVSESHITRFLTRCEVAAWILPTGDPFTMLSYYTDKPLFSDEFRQMFSANYQQVRAGKAFQVWRCRSAAATK